MRLFCRRDAGAEFVRGDGLPDRANVVPLALDGHQRSLFDRLRLDRVAAHPKARVRQIVVVKDSLDGLQVKIRRQIHDRGVLLVKGASRRCAFAIALYQVVKHRPVRGDMAVEVHAEKAGKL